VKLRFLEKLRIVDILRWASRFSAFKAGVLNEGTLQTADDVRGVRGGSDDLGLIWLEDLAIDSFCLKHFIYIG
jgi:hypothetical protein